MNMTDPKAAPKKVESKIPIAHIEAIITVACCEVADGQVQRFTSELTPVVDVAADSGGMQLGKVACHGCGSEYLFGVIAKTLEEARASEVFEHLTDEEEEKIGVDRKDFDPAIEDAAMCARCDNDADRRTDFCGGCKEYICQDDRLRTPARPARHQVEEHWQAPTSKGAQASQAASNTVDDDDDGSNFDLMADEGDVFRPERD